MPPEFISGVIRHTYDIYSLGVIIMEILTGKKGYHQTEDVRAIYAMFKDKNAWVMKKIILCFCWHTVILSFGRCTISFAHTL